MNNKIKYVLISLFIFMLYYFSNVLVKEKPDFLSDGMLSFLMIINLILSKPLEIFNMMLSEEYVQEHIIFFQLITSLIIAIPFQIIFKSQVDDYEKFIKEQKPYILYQFENAEKERKESVLPYSKSEKLLDKFGMFKISKIEKEIYYYLSLHLPDEMKKIFCYQVKKIKRSDRFLSPNSNKIAYSFISFKSMFGYNSIKKVFPSKILESNGNKNEFVLATIIFKDKDYNMLIAEVWIKDLKLNRIEYRMEKEIEPNKDYDYMYSILRINLLINES